VNNIPLEIGRKPAKPEQSLPEVMGYFGSGNLD
jgi:hypothetical protein